MALTLLLTLIFCLPHWYWKCRHMVTLNGVLNTSWHPCPQLCTRMAGCVKVTNYGERSDREWHPSPSTSAVSAKCHLTANAAECTDEWYRVVCSSTGAQAARVGASSWASAATHYGCFQTKPPVTNCTGERSFSHLKRIKSALRSTQAQERLNNLSLLNIESDLLQKLDFSTVIDAFSSAKCRKRSFWLSELLKFL